jgi:MFS family permease
MTLKPVPGADVAALSRSTVWFMAIAAALGTASIYPLQPAIANVAGSLDISPAQAGVALACGPVGYLLGLAVLVPLVDRFPPKYVLATQFGLLALALAANAAAGTPWLLGLAVGVIGAGSTVGAGGNRTMRWVTGATALSASRRESTPQRPKSGT